MRCAMGKSRRVGHDDLRSLYLTIGECKGLGADPVAWRLHILESLLRLLDADHGSCFDLDRDGALDPARGPMVPTHLVDAGIADAGVRRGYRGLISASVAFVSANSAVP